MPEFNFDSFKRFVRVMADSGEHIAHGGHGVSAWCGCAVGLHLEHVTPNAPYVELTTSNYADYAQSVEDHFEAEAEEEKAFSFEGYGYESVFELLNESSPATYAELDKIITEVYG